MFTGLIQEVGKIKSIRSNQEGLEICVESNSILEGIQLGDSIAINGACQTVTKFDQTSLTVQAIDETIKKTNFKSLKVGHSVNLEPALRLSDRLGGHIVQGHVNGVGSVYKLNNIGKNFLLDILCPKSLLPYTIDEGSICLNGISLTIAKKFEDSCILRVSIIPHTWNHTNLRFLNIASDVNIEVDVLAKYAENFFKASNKQPLTLEWLSHKGF